MNFVGQRSQERTHTPLTFSTTKSSKLGTANLKKQNSSRKPGPKITHNAERTAEELIDRQVQKNMQRLLDSKGYKDKYISPAPTKNTRATPFQGSKFKGSPAQNLKTRQVEHLQQSTSNTRSNKKIYLSPKIEPKFKKGQRAGTDQVLSKKHKKVVQIANSIQQNGMLPPKQKLTSVNSLSRLLQRRPSDCVDADDSLDEHQLIYNTQDLRPGFVQEQEDVINQEIPMQSVRATQTANQLFTKSPENGRKYQQNQLNRKHRQNRSFHDHVALYMDQNLENLIEYEEDTGSVEAVRINKSIKTNLGQHNQNQTSQFVVRHLNDYDKSQHNNSTDQSKQLFNAERGTESYLKLKETSKRNRSKEASIQRLAEVKEQNIFGKEQKVIYGHKLGPKQQQTPLPAAEKFQMGEVKPFSKNIQSKKSYFDNSATPSTNNTKAKRKVTEGGGKVKKEVEPVRKKATSKYDKHKPPQPMLIDTETSDLLGERSLDQMSIQPLKGKIKRKMLDLTGDSQQNSSKETKVYSFLSKQASNSLHQPPVLSTKNKDTEKLHFFQDQENVAAFRPQMMPVAQKKAIPQRQITIYKRQKSNREEHQQQQQNQAISFSKMPHKNSSMIQKIEETMNPRKRNFDPSSSFSQQNEKLQPNVEQTPKQKYSQKPSDMLIQRFQKNVPSQNHFSKALIHHANLQLSSNSGSGMDQRTSSLQQQQKMEGSREQQPSSKITGIEDFNEDYIPTGVETQEQRKESVNDMRKRILEQLTFQPLLEGCQCTKIELAGPRLVTPVICEHAHLWMSKSYEKYNEEACLSTYNQIVQQDWSQKFQKQIQADIERTFFANPYFNRKETHEALERILLAFANIEPSVGYCQGMNFVAAAMLYHAGEVPAFFLLKNLMEKHGVADIFRNGLPGVQKHQAAVEKLGETLLPDLFEHLENLDFVMSMVATDWIMGMFLNFIPLDINHIFLDKFFTVGWKIFYQLCVSLLWYNYDTIIQLEDPMEIVGHLKQARDGCEHLKPQLSLKAISSASSEAESQRASLAYEETQQKFYLMWSEILDLATVSWDQLNEQYAKRNKDFKKNGDIATKMKKKFDKMRGKKQKQ